MLFRKEKQVFPLQFSRFFVTLRSFEREIFRFAQGKFSVSAKKEISFFVLRSTFRNFAAEIAIFTKV